MRHNMIAIASADAQRVLCGPQRLHDRAPFWLSSKQCAAALAAALTVSVGVAPAAAATLYLNIVATTEITSEASIVYIPGPIEIFRYGVVTWLDPDGYLHRDSGFYTSVFDNVVSTPSGDGSVTSNAAIIQDGSPCGNMIDIYGACFEPTVGPDAAFQGVAADYDFARGETFYADAHVDEAGTLISVTYSPIPEPAVWCTMLIGLAALGVRHRYWSRMIRN